jgi:cytochrome d ubiquinol oxidase subunit II
MSLVDAVAGAALLGLIAYAVLGGADFGGGVWDLFASGPRKLEQRAAIARAMGPVWEANHVWLIFVVVVFFSAFPTAWAGYTTALFTPLRLVLLGITLRGIAFVFRAYSPHERQERARGRRGALFARGIDWGPVFGGASIVTPFLLGVCVGAISSGAIRFEAFDAAGQSVPAADGGWVAPWLSPISLAMGFAAASLCAYTAAVFLTVEAEGALQEEFRRRALLSGGVVCVGAAATIPFTRVYAPVLWDGLMAARSIPILVLGTVAALTCGGALLSRRYRLARVAVVLQVAFVVGGWGVAQWPYLVYPDVTLESAAAPPSMLRFLLGSLPFGLLVVGPSMAWLFHIFKADRKEADATSPPKNARARGPHA